MFDFRNFLKPKFRPNSPSSVHGSASLAVASSSIHGGPRVRPSIAGLLIDVSGNLHVGTTPISGAVEAIDRLVNAGIPFRLCSNTSKESTADLVKRLETMNFNLKAAEKTLESTSLVATHSQNGESEGAIRKPRLVWTSIGAVAQALETMGSRSPYCLLSDSAHKEVLDALNLSANSPQNVIRDNNSPSEYDAVVVGLAPSRLGYENLNLAFRILKGETSTPSESTSINGESSSPPPLIATHRAKFVQSDDHKLSLGPGPFVAALENAAGPGVRAMVVGKPEAAFFQMVIDDFGDSSKFLVDGELGPSMRSRIAVIGDDVEADLGGGAVELGLWRVLVKTGKYRPGDEIKAGVVPPDEVYESFAEFVESLLKDISKI